MPYLGSFSPGNYVVCSVETTNGSGQTAVMDMLRNGSVILTGSPGTVPKGTGYWWMHYTLNPKIPSGSYLCRFKVSGKVLAQLPFTIS